MKQLCVKFELEYYITTKTKHNSYTNEAAGKTFVHYNSVTKTLAETLTIPTCKYFFILMDPWFAQKYLSMVQICVLRLT